MIFPEYLHLRMAAFGNAFLAGKSFASSNYFTGNSSIAFFDGDKIVGRSVTDWWNFLAEQGAKHLGFKQKGVVVQLPYSLIYWKRCPHDSRLRSLLYHAYSEEWPFLDESNLNIFARNTPVYAPFRESGLLMPRSGIEDIRRISAEFGSVMAQINEFLKFRENEWKRAFLEIQDLLISGSKNMATRWIKTFEGEEADPKHIEIHQNLPDFGYSIEAHRLLNAAICASDNHIENHGYEGWQHQDWSAPFRDGYYLKYMEAIAAAPNSFQAS